MTTHRMKDRREPFLIGGWTLSPAFALASGFSVTLQNNRLGRIYIARRSWPTSSVWTSAVRHRRRTPGPFTRSTQCFGERLRGETDVVIIRE